MKIVLIVIGALLGAYTAVAVVQFVRTLFTTDFANERAIANLAAGLFVVCLPGALSFFCLQYAFRKRKPKRAVNDQGQHGA